MMEADEDTLALYIRLLGARRPRPAQLGRHSAIPHN
jgi:hypothetical protein